jgi:hypothetical protein
MIDVGLYIFYVLFFIAIGSAIIFPLLYVIQHPKGLVKSLAGIVGLVAVFIVAYLISGNEVTLKYTQYGVGAGSSKMIGAGLIVFYVALFSAIIGVIYSEISKALK